MSTFWTAILSAFSRRRRGLASELAPGGGNFVPSGSEFVAAQAVFSAKGANGYIYVFDGPSLRATENGADGITSGPISYANDHRAPGTASAAVSSPGHQPSLTTIAGVTYATLDGTDLELLWPQIMWSSGTLVIVARMTSDTASNQTVLETTKFRVHSQYNGLTGPQVRVGGSVFNAFGLASMLDRHTVLVVQFNNVSNTLRLWYDGASEWVVYSVASWDDNPHPSWPRQPASIIGRTSYEPTLGAPMTGGVHSLVTIDTDQITVEQVQALVDLAIKGTSISATVPAYDGGVTPPPSTEELPPPISEVTLASQGAFDAWKAGPPPAGQHATLTFNPSLGALTFDGTTDNPIVIKADSILGRTVTGCGDITGDNLRIYGFDWGAISPGLLNGENLWFVRNLGTNGLKIRFRAKGGRAWYCKWNGGSGNRAIAFDTGVDAGGAGRTGIQGHVKGCHFKDWGPGGANGTETITVGFSSGRTAVVSDTLIEESLFQDCNQGGQEDETISIKSSSVTVRGCTFERTRWCQVRHGKNNTIEGCVHTDSTNGGFRIRDYNARLVNCRTEGASGTEVFAGTTLSGAEDASWPDSGIYPRAYRCVIDNHNAVNTAPVIGKQFSTPFSPGYPAKETKWRGNKGIAPVKAREESTSLGIPSPIAYVPPTTLTPSDVGPDVV